MQLKYRITDTRLIITADAEDQAELQRMRDGGECFQSDQTMYDAFDHLIANSELTWINPKDTGDLTDAPILGVLGEEGIKQHTVFLENYGLVETGSDGFWTMVQPILKRWAFMDYQLRSPLEDLVEKGKAVFISE
jgi:hypothetical protein